jgi:hypothetical protein
MWVINLSLIIGNPYAARPAGKSFRYAALQMAALDYDSWKRFHIPKTLCSIPVGEIPAGRFLRQTRYIVLEMLQRQRLL